jgi:N-acetylglucosaminyldiphosphoundecaprenol N-acetyl-beta-D-mannosaminyltransferase
MDKVNLFNIMIDNVAMADALNLIKNSIHKKEKRKIYFVNADCFNKIFKDRNYYSILKRGHYIFGDGSGAKLGGKLTNQRIIDNVNGTDMLPLLAKMCAENRYSLFLLGAKEGVAKKASENLVNDNPDLKIAGTHHGFFDKKSESSKIVEIINGVKADVLLVAFGAPYQEMWIDEFCDALNVTVMIGVGGLFDFFSGSIPRAPRWMRVSGIEWIYRLMQEPKRMWKRYIIGNPQFVFRVLKWKMTGKGDIYND